ncbi:MAG: SAM-dependent methyltransferase [Burkholderiales bacterium]|nr:SAM-dependent methyltransferase [Burkholderiales bacterium]
MKPVLPHLPRPDTDALAHSRRVMEHVRQLIARHGDWLSLYDYINAVLFAPTLGYYVSGTRKLSGDIDGSDFVTAPELTPLFARVWAKPIADALAKSHVPCVLELGAGSGAFAAELLKTWMSRHVDIERYAILERSADLRVRQQEYIRHHIPEMAERVIWLDHLPNTIDGVVFMNEVLDAIPPHVVSRRNGVWLEQGVVFEHDRLAIEAKPLTESILLQAAQKRFPPDGDYTAEINLDAEALIETLARALVAAKGHHTLWVVDYGFERGAHLPEHYADGTLRAYYRHHLLDDIFYLPGLIDITAHIDFVSILEAAQRGELVLANFQTQREWLLSHGLLDELQRCGAPNTPEAVQTLIAPDAMGNIFKTLELESKDAVLK